jgi:hypothetical protein
VASSFVHVWSVPVLCGSVRATLAPGAGACALSVLLVLVCGVVLPCVWLRVAFMSYVSVLVMAVSLIWVVLVVRVSAGVVLVLCVGVCGVFVLSCVRSWVASVLYTGGAWAVLVPCASV